MSAMSSLFSPVDFSQGLAKAMAISTAGCTGPGGLPSESPGSCSCSPSTEFCDPNCSREAKRLSYKVCRVGSDHTKPVKADHILQAARLQILRECSPR